ncbi:group III truncated hemoglobin [Flavobacterium sp. MFBS3-15]|uniref:group III truncated hemoglobin n=1 Tax=Flavobacterium sp. MFBS3-15 TaxID=2989816 RepID=UPI0022369BFA|nr:group III truncated hemoglobin [Flavobacterium sp. MFBS3-15]MCW4470686.1 group III truncated hemoglobin [Flavobacterium sp. MFBS3-15]
MKDIENRQDLEFLLSQFYDKLLKDPAISYIFTDVAKVDLAHHLPILADFWELSLFHTGNYRNNPMQVHMELNSKEKLTEKHFNIWLNHFYDTVDEHFEGLNAEKIKTRAVSISTVIKIKLAPS